MSRLRRGVIGLIIFLVVAGLLGFFAGPPLIRHVAEQQLGKQLERPVSIGRIALNPYTLSLEANRIHIGERDGAGAFVDIERLLVRPSWSSLLHAAPVINEVRIDSPRVHLVRYGAQRFNFTDLIEKFSKPAAPGSKPALFSVSNIRLENGQITFDDRLLGEKHVLDHWKLGIPFIATLPTKTDIFVEPLLRARLNGNPLELNGKTKPFMASRESEVALRFSGFDVPRLLSYVPVKLPVVVQSGKLSVNLKMDFEMSGEAPTLRVSGTTDLTQVHLLDAQHKPFFAAQALHLAAATLEPLKHSYRFDEIRVEAPTVNLARDKAGVLSIERMLAAQAPVAQPAAGASKTPVAHAATAATKAAPLNLSVKHFALNNGTLNFSDAAASRPTQLGLTKIAVGLADFSTLGKTPAHFTLSTAFRDAPGSLDAAGTLGLATHTALAQIDLKTLSLPLLQPYLDGVTAAQVSAGTVSANASVSADWSQTPLNLKLGESALTVQALKLAAPRSKAPALTLAQGRIEVKQVDVPARLAEIARVDASGLTLNAERWKDGRIDLAALAGPHQAAPARSALKKLEQEPGWRYSIGELNLTDSSATWLDRSTPRPVKLTLAPLQLNVRQISQDMKRPLPLNLRVTLNRKGTLAASGEVTPTPLKLSLKLNAQRLDTTAFEPYFGQALNTVIASAWLNANGHLALSQARALKATYRGDAALVDVRMLDKVTSDSFAGWRSLAFTGLKANYDASGVDIDTARVTFAHFYGRVMLDAQGKLNLKEVVAQKTGAAQSLTRGAASDGHEPVPLTPEAASAPVSASAPEPAFVASAATADAASGASVPATVVAAAPPQHPVRLHFGQLVLQNGRVKYTDNFIKPNFTADLVHIKGTVGAFGTESKTSAAVDIDAQLAANGPLAIRGTVNPLIQKPALDLTATAHSIALTNLTPYSAKYAGYPITKGKLNVDLHYKLENNQLSANNHLFIDQLTFGDHVDNKTATRLPVRLAISLLKNSRGEIDVNIPVHGSLDNPEFSLGGLIWHALLNLLQKAVTAPFTLLASAFGGNGQELGYVEFEPGSAKLSAASDKKLDTIARALADKPSIRLDLIGRVDPKLDEPALRELYVERLVKQQKIKGLVGNGESIDLSTVTVTPDEYSKYLTKAYKNADFKKPRNLIGMTKSQPDEVMKQALAEHASVDEASLRELAQRRTQHVRQYFEGKIDSSRIFIVAPKLDAKGISDKGATTRVDFGLK